MEKIKIYEELLNRTLTSLRAGTFSGKERYKADVLYDAIVMALREPADDNWISVEDRLPEPYEKVLVFGDFDNIVNYRVDYLDVYGIWIHSFHVTHWQYLPEPPKGE